MPDLDAFEAKVKAHIKQLLAKDAASRRKAAEWLGEAGDPTAITALAQAYKNDADPKVRDAAAYSLGMFRKLELELGGPRSAETIKLLEKVADGKMGGRVPISVRKVVKLQLALLVSAILLVILAFVLPPIIKGGGININLGSGGESTDNNQAQGVDVPDKDRVTLLNDLRSALSLTTNNASKLQAQYQLRLGGGQLTCNEFFDTLTPITLSTNNSRDYPDLAQIAATINQAQTDLVAAKQTYDQVCDEGQTIDAGEFGSPMAMVVAIVQQLTTAGDSLTAAEVMANADSTTAPVEAPTIEVVPTSSLNAEIRSHITPLQTIVDDMTAPRGAYTLLVTYLTEASTGTTLGCQDTPPIIPEDYVISDELSNAAPSLKLSVDLVNTGLRLLREGWTQFTTACSGNTVGQVAPTGLANMGNADIAFDTAATQLAGLRSGT